MQADVNGHPDKMKKNKTLVLVGILLVSFSSLMLEILITRLFSTVIWYHYAFIAVSVAMFGLGFGGVFAHYIGRKVPSMEIATVATLTFSLSIPAVLYVILQFPISVYALYVFYAVSMVPFFFCGICVSSVFQSQSKTVYALYFADMIGASLGCFMVEPVLGPLSAESAVLLVGLIIAVSGTLFAFATKKRKFIAFSLAVLILSSGMLATNAQTLWLRAEPNESKSLYRALEDSSLTDVYTDWNSFSRVDVVEGFPAGSPIAASIYIDADAGTNVYRFNGTLNDATFLKDMIYYTPYTIVEDPTHALVIGSGGGGDVLTALHGGTKQVTAVELNPIVIDVVKNLGAKGGNIYSYDDGMAPYDDVHEVVADGRSYISRSTEQYDVIVLTMVDSWAALASGGYALAENYLYTQEAFQQYYNHLTNSGVLSITRFIKEVPKLVTTATELLIEQGVAPEDVGKYMSVTTWEYEPGRVAALFMLKKAPFTQLEAQTVSTATLEMGENHDILHTPYIETQEPYAELLTGEVTLEEFYANSDSQIRPATDDNPYFFDFEKGIPESLTPLMLFAIIATAGVCVFPLVRKHSEGKGKLAKAAPFILYFAALGAGYMLIEITLVQKFILFLGYPTRSLEVILFTLLLSTGVGSFAGKFLKTKDASKTVLYACSAITAIAGTYFFTLNPLLSALLPLEALARSAIAIALIFPLGFFMGIPFPTGISLIAANTKISVPWMWAINGVTSVLGSVLATGIGIMMGLSTAMLLALACYALVFVSTLTWRRHLQQP
jgi:MFS family permease